MARHLIGVQSPPDNFVPDPMTLGPVLPPGWDGDAWIHPAEWAYFLRAWCPATGRVAVGHGGTYADAREALLEEVYSGTSRVEVLLID